MRGGGKVKMGRLSCDEDASLDELVIRSRFPTRHLL